MKLTHILTTLISLAAAAPAPTPLEKRFPSNALTPIYSHLWQSNVWTPLTNYTGHAKWAPSDSRGFPIDTISTFSVANADVGKTFQLGFFSPGGYPPIQAVQLYSNINVPPAANQVPQTTSNGRDQHLGTFRADAAGPAVEIAGGPGGWKNVVFRAAGKYAFSVVGIYVQNPTDLEWDTRTYGLYLKRV